MFYAEIQDGHQNDEETTFMIVFLDFEENEYINKDFGKKYRITIITKSGTSDTN